MALSEINHDRDPANRRRAVQTLRSRLIRELVEDYAHERISYDTFRARLVEIDAATKADGH